MMFDSYAFVKWDDNEVLKHTQSSKSSGTGKSARRAAANAAATMIVAQGHDGRDMVTIFC